MEAWTLVQQLVCSHCWEQTGCVSCLDQGASYKRSRHELKVVYNNAKGRAAIRADAQRVAIVDQVLQAHPTDWRLTRAVTSNVWQPSLSPLRCSDGNLVHRTQEKAGLRENLFVANSHVPFLTVVLRCQIFLLGNVMCEWSFSLSTPGSLIFYPDPYCRSARIVCEV